MNAKEALQLTQEATAKKQADLVAQATPILEEIYERIKTAASHEKDHVILGGENDKSDVGRKLAQLGVTGIPFTKVGEYVAGVLKREGYQVKTDGYGVHIDWKNAGQPTPRGMPDR